MIRECAPSTEVSSVSVIDDCYRQAVNLRECLLLQAPHPYGTPPELSIEEGVTYTMDASDGIDYTLPGLSGIRGSSKQLRAALDDPATVHTALDTYLELEKIAWMEPTMGYNLLPVTSVLDEQGRDSLHSIISGDDQLASVKALRLACSRATVDTSYAGLLKQVMPTILALEDAQGPVAAEARLLYRDIIDAVAVLDSNHGGKTTQGSASLFTAFMEALGYHGPNMYLRGWVTHLDKDRGRWVRENIKNMLALERMEPGLCRKLTDTFNIVNFARRSPKFYANMYRMRMEHPEMPYVMGFAAAYDHNYAFYNSRHLVHKAAKKLEAAGVRYEEHECLQVDDVAKACEKALALNLEHGAEIVDFAVFAHGTPETMTLNPEQAIEPTNIDCLSALKTVLRPDARGVFKSCSTGKEEGDKKPIAAAVASMLGRVVIAPSVDSAGRLWVRKEANERRLDIDYTAMPYGQFRNTLIGLRYLLHDIYRIGAGPYKEIKRSFDPDTGTSTWVR